MTSSALTVWASGQGSVPAGWLNRAIQNVDNVAALRAQPGISGMVAEIQGTSVPGDGGNGFFWWNAASTAPDDNGVTTIIPNGYTVGAWNRQPVSAATIPPSSITNAQLANAPAKTLKGNLTASSGSVTDNLMPAVTAALGYSTTALQGAILLATTAQAIAGTNTTNAITPATLSAVLAGSSLGITTAGDTSISLPAANAAVGTVGSSGAIIFNNTLILNWAFVQMEDFNAQTSTSWTYASPNKGVSFVTAPIIPFATNVCAMAGQGANANRGVLSLNSASTTAASWILRDTAATSTLGVWLVGMLGF